MLYYNDFEYICAWTIFSFEQQCALFIWSSAVAYDNSEQEWSQGMKEKKYDVPKPESRAILGLSEHS